MADIQLLELHNLKFSWNPKGPYLIDVDSFVVNQGEKVFIYGPSGVGKSTFLNLLSGVLSPQAGQIKVLGQNLVSMPESQKDGWRGDHMGFIFQMFNLLPYLSAYENIILPLSFSEHKRQRLLKNRNINDEVDRLISALDLTSDILNQKVNHLSVGQQQRVAACRALVGSPELIIADEPTSALDANARQGFLDLLFSECSRNNLGLIFVSHDMALGEKFDRVIALADINKAQTRAGDQ